MQKITFEEKAVAFIDVLGFKPLVKHATYDSKKLAELEELIELLSTAVPELDGTMDASVPKSLIPKYIYISDSIILSAPLTSKERLDYEGLSVLVMRVIQLTHVLLRKGYLIRGGISVGDVWHTESNIVGSAYQDAYLIESENPDPCVKLSPTATEHWNKKVNESGCDNMCLKYENDIMVNGLHDAYIKDKSHGAVKRAFDDYACIVNREIEKNHTGNVRDKWCWFKQYLDSEVKRNQFIVASMLGAL
ncbi:MAG: hypothetical protein ACUZ8H_14970 [Candidatus Anammoxibacter sp.]